MPDYVPIQDLTIVGSVGDNDLFPMSDGSGAYAVKGSTIKSYAASDAAAAAADAEASKAAAQSAATAAGNAQTIAEGAASTAAGAVTTAQGAVATANAAVASVAELETEVDSDFAVLRRQNLANGITIETLNGRQRLVFPVALTPGEYTLYINAASTNTSVMPYLFVSRSEHHGSAYTLYSTRIKNGSPDCFSFKVDNSIKSIYVFAASTTSGSEGYTVTISSIELYGGQVIKADGTNVTRVISTILNNDKRCDLPSGDYTIENLVMPDSSILSGDGGTNLYMDDNAVGVAVMMGNRCTVQSLAIYGADSDIQLPPADFEPSIGTTDYFATASHSIGNGWVRYWFSSPRPAGKYRLKTNIASSNTGVMLYVKVFSSQTYNNNSIVEQGRTTNGAEADWDFEAESPFSSIYLLAASNVSLSANYTIVVNEESELHSVTTLIGDRHGVAWQPQGEDSTEVEFGLVTNCRIERFDGSAIRMRDTGTPVDNNLSISDCFIRNCAVGIYIQRNAEFNKVSNTTIVRCWYGILNRGGNNNFSNCGIDGNVVGIQIDQDEGENSGHGVIEGCSINHSGSNTGYGLIIKETGRMIVSNCNMYYSKIKLDSTDGNVITSCGFGRNAGLDIISGDCSMICNCMMRTVSDFPVTRTGNTTARIINCYTRGGVEVTG